MSALLAAFPTPEALLAAAREAADRGWRPVDAFTPYPLEALDDVLAPPPTRLPWVMLAAGVAVAAALYGLEWWSATHAYPFNTGGRPLNSWPTFLIAAAELGVLGAGAAGFIAFLVGSGLPSLNHPLFDRLPFERASQDQFLLAAPALPGEAGLELRALLFAKGAVWVEEAEL